MKSRHVFVMGVVALGLSSQMALAMGGDRTNKYFNTSPDASCATTLEGSQKTERSLSVEGTSSSSTLIEKTVSSPVVIEGTSASPVVIEDRIVKQKHFFKIGIWPLFDFEVL